MPQFKIKQADNLSEDNVHENRRGVLDPTFKTVLKICSHISKLCASQLGKKVVTNKQRLFHLFETNGSTWDGNNDMSLEVIPL